jgi:hypothetical protein
MMQALNSQAKSDISCQIGFELPVNQRVRIFRLLQRFGFLFAVLFIAACTNREATFVPAPQDADKGSVVYIYRPSAATNFMMSPKVVIDGNEKFSISSGDYRYVYLAEGNHKVGLNPADQYMTDPAVVITIEADQSYYLRVNTSLKFEAEKMNTRRFWIEKVSGKQALDEIAATRYSGPQRQQAAAEQSEDAATNTGFSIDKARDPFSAN